MSEFLRDLWYLAALSKEVRPGSLHGKSLLGEPVVLGRTAAGEAFALRDLCPHRGVPLSAGRLHSTPTGPLLECPFHGWRFRPDGVCAEIPSLVSGAAMRPEQVRCGAYPLHEAHGLVWIYMPADLKRPAAPAVPPPALGRLAVGGRPKAVERRLFALPLDHAVTGLLDPAHGPYVHQQWWWRTPAGQQEKQKRFEPRPMGFTMVRHAPSANSRAYALLGGAPETEIAFELPSTRWEDIAVGARRFVTMSWLTPLDAQHTEFTQLLFWDLPVLDLLAPLIRSATARFLAQDQAMAALQRQGLAHDPAMLWIEDADVQALWYRRLKKAWALARETGQPFANPLQPATLRWRT